MATSEVVTIGDAGGGSLELLVRFGVVGASRPVISESAGDSCVPITSCEVYCAGPEFEVEGGAGS